ncbi:hypothetical protein QBC38DRAFT_404891 [Podospora fimiseda]|uniref:Uncharacterized protein n=1 Tax=Podospora fimiseda TaxID=252190 RepID=A0AAN6YLY0_9PEZI|nr:hypothetical protein QBC38DRAFT_404891 [Podospora fimiseda]
MVPRNSSGTNLAELQTSPNIHHFANKSSQSVLDPYTMSGIEVTNLSKEEMLKAVREELGKTFTQEDRSELQMDANHDDKNFVAVIVDFDGPSGLIIIDGVWLQTGPGKTENGKYLYITSDADVFGEDKPDVQYIRLK